MISRMPRMRARIPAEAGGMQQAHRAQRKHLATARGRLPEPLDGVLQIAGAPFGERERSVGHPPSCIRSCGRAAAIARWK